MKYLTLLGLVLLGGCVQSPNPKDYDYCLTEQAQLSITSGSVSVGPIRSTVRKMVNACIPENQQTPDLNERAKQILIQLLQDEV